MSGLNNFAPAPGGRVHPGRSVPALPRGIPILPGQAKAKRRVPVRLIIIVVVVGLVGLEWYNIHSSDYDKDQIDAVVKYALLAHVPKGTRLPVTLWSGPRLLEIELAFPERQPGRAPDTCVTLNVLDPTTGAKDTSEKYRTGAVTCIDGVAVTIR
jgi:hypothetical protein